jgi:hypothetical protein
MLLIYVTDYAVLLLVCMSEGMLLSYMPGIGGFCMRVTVHRSSAFQVHHRPVQAACQCVV